ncbi:unnamed protein product [Closterium sp. NIES-53]
MSLGDHDNKGSVAAQVAHSHASTKWYLPAPYYSLSLPLPHSRPAASGAGDLGGGGGGVGEAGADGVEAGEVGGGGGAGAGAGEVGGNSGDSGVGSSGGGAEEHIDFFFTNSIGLEGVLGASNDNDRRFFSNYSLDLVGPQVRIWVASDNSPCNSQK